MYFTYARQRRYKGCALAKVSLTSLPIGSRLFPCSHALALVFTLCHYLTCAVQVRSRPFCPGHSLIPGDVVRYGCSRPHCRLISASQPANFFFPARRPFLGGYLDPSHSPFNLRRAIFSRMGMARKSVHALVSVICWGREVP